MIKLVRKEPYVLFFFTLMRLSIGHRNSWHQKALAWLSWRRTILTIGQQKNLISSFRCHISWCHISWYHISWHHISWRHIWWCHIWWLYISWHHIPPPPNTRNVQYIQTWPRQSFIIRMMKKAFVAITYFNTFTTIELHVQMNKFGNRVHFINATTCLMYKTHGC